jgi:hypothetical protein
MLIDCDACAVRGPACGDCVVSVLLAGPGVHAHAEPHVSETLPAPELDAAERAAIAVLAGCGLVPPLRLVPLDEPGPGSEGGGGHRRAGPVAEGEREVS